MGQNNQIGFSTNTIVRDEDGEILLIKREDLRLWVMPGGQVEYGETLEEAARREAFEETGIEIEIDELHGIYYVGITGRNYLAFVYNARPVGGEITTSFESVDVRYFPPEALPERIPNIVRERINDAVKESQSVLVSQSIPGWQQVLLNAFFGLRNFRNRYILRHPTPPATLYSVIFQAVVNETIVAKTSAVRGNVPWQKLYEAVDGGLKPRIYSP